MAVDNIEILEKLDSNKQLAFAYLTCERLYPNYTYFSKKYEFGNIKTLRSAIDFIHDNLFLNISPKTHSILSYIQSVKSNIPLPENYDTVLASAALDACKAILVTLDFILNRKPLRVGNLSTFATDTVDMFIQENYDLDFNTDKEFEQKIATHPFMEREITIQKGIITYLSKITRLEPADIHNLLNLQANDKKSNIDLQ